jgi:hypothetical protein
MARTGHFRPIDQGFHKIHWNQRFRCMAPGVVGVQLETFRV